MKKHISLKLTALVLSLLMFLSACKGGGGGSTGGKTENPSQQLNIKSLSEITTATDPEYADALVAETELYSDSLVHTGKLTYKENKELPDISAKFPKEKYKNYSYKDFEYYIGDGFKKSGYSSVNNNYTPYTAAESKVFQINFGKDFEVRKVTIKWSEKNAVRGRIQFSDDTYTWYNGGEQFVLNSKKNEITVETNETHRKYMRIYFPTSIKIEGISDVTVYGCPSNPTAKIPDGAVVNNVATPTIYSIATSVEGVKEPVISLAGTWKFCAEPQDDFWENDADLSKWHDVPVPGDPDNLHLGIRTIKNNSLKENYPTAYKLRTTIPKDYEGKDVILQLDGVQFYSRIFVNGELVRVHRNGTTTFSCLITDYVEAGKDAIITIEATSEVIQGESSLYQGITGYPRLMAVPKESISRLQYEVDLDKTYTNATLDVSASAFTSASKLEGKVKIELKDPDGKPVELKNNTAGFKGICEATVIRNEIKNVKVYNDEHPNLYTLTAYMLDKNGKVTETLVKKVGFKEIEVSGNKVLINGESTKLRGVNWNNLSPTAGLVADYWSDRESLIKLKAANVNYIRTSHHPQYSYVFDICDELGIYVEQECALAMICEYNNNVYEQYEKICNPNESDWYHNYYAEMVEMARSNASLLFYSLGNESSWEINIQTGAAYIKAVDTKHLTKFSWGYFQPAKTSTDIFSVHYPNKAAIYNLSTTEVPYIYDEYAHIYGHVPASYYEDPSLALHWGLEDLWDLVYNQDGGLGGAAWHGRDWVTLTPTGTEKYFSRYWGILDTWNREREEYWVTKKAYSPIQIDEEKVYNVPSGDVLEFEVENRYRHTNLKDIKIECTVNGKAVEAAMPSVAATKTGKIQIKYSGFKNGDVVKLLFRDNTGKLENYIVDEYEFTLGGRKAPAFAAVSKDAAPAISDDGTKITVTGNDFSIEFDKTTGKVTDGKYKGKTAIVGGPELNLGRLVSLTKWKLSSITSKTEGTEAVITVKGDYAQVSGVIFNIRIDASGRMDTRFNVNLPGGEIEEMGVTYTIKEAKELNWSSDVFNYSVYPQASVGRLSGTAVAHRATEKVLSILEKPTWYKYMNTTTLGVEDDGKNYTDDFRARRHNVFYEQVTTNDDVVITFESNGKGCAKISSTGDKEKNMNFILGCEWGHYTTPGEECCNYDNPPSKLKGDYSGSIVIRLGGEKY